MKILKKGIVLLLLSMVIFLITGIPYFYGWIISTPESHFAGFADGHADIYSYFSLVRQAVEGKFLFEDRYTTAPHDSILFNWVWLGLGRLMAYTGWGIAITYQFFRYVIVLGFVGILYTFLGLYMQGSTRLLSLMFILLGGGFGGIVRSFNKILNILPIDLAPIDVAMWESHSFSSLMLLPHFNLAIILILLIYMAFLGGLESHRKRYWGIAGLISLLLLFFHPFEFGVYFPVLALTTMLFCFSRWGDSTSAIKGLILVLLLSLPGLAYCFIMGREILWKEVMAEMDQTTLDVFMFVLGFGLPFILALLTFRGLPSLDKVSPRQILLYSWLLGGFFLCYLPVKFKWHLINGWQIPLYISMMQGLEERIIPYLKNSLTGFSFFRRWDIRKLTYGIIFLLISITPLYLIQSRIKNIRNNFGQLPYFFCLEEKEAMKWLSHNSLPEEGVFSGPRIGNVLPAYTGNKVFIGHHGFTPGKMKKIKIYEEFWNSFTTSLNRSEWLKENNIKFIYRGREERTLGGNYDPERDMAVKKVFSSNRVSIFKVN